MDDSFHGCAPSRDALTDRLNAIARIALGLSHELNNACGALQSNVDILRRKIDAESPFCANLGHLQHATGHVMELSRTLQIYTQRARTELDDINLPPLLARAVRALKGAAPENCKVRVRAIRGQFTVSTCPVMLGQALEGIMQNAVDALQGCAGAITIESCSGFERVIPGEGLLFGALPPDGGALIEISDTGEGMAQEVLAHCLEPFFSTRIRARGLGLAPAAGLVFHCNAAIHIVSEPGRGTSFRLLLPAADAGGV